MKFKHLPLSLFTFTPKDRKGISVLLVLFLIVLGIKIYLIDHSDENINWGDIEIEFIEGEASMSDQDEMISKYVDQSVVTPIERSNELFDPNTVSEKELCAIGFSSFAAGNLVKYREKGGVFKSKEDLLKIYGVDTIFFRTIQSQLIIENDYSQAHKFICQEIIELNMADTNTLQKLPSIGIVKSKRIVKYRNLLGGFYSKLQIREVYGIDSTCYSTICPHIRIDTSFVVKIDINTVNEKELSRHPYIKKYQARALVKYRKLVGQFNSPNELKTNNIIQEPDFSRVVSYLTITGSD